MYRRPYRQFDKFVGAAVFTMKGQCKECSDLLSRHLAVDVGSE